MSNLNVEWLSKNLPSNPIILDVGCAGLEDTVNFRKAMPNAKIFAFECNDYFLENNIRVAKEYDIEYQHVAISFTDGLIDFWASLEKLGENYPVSGSICYPTELIKPENTDQWKWAPVKKVNTISLNTFFQQKNIVPDFMHIDTQGAEYKIISAMDEKFKPKIIWAEICDFTTYDSGVTYEMFLELMTKLNYVEKHRSHDGLYVLKDYQVTDYISI